MLFLMGKCEAFCIMPFFKRLAKLLFDIIKIASFLDMKTCCFHVQPSDIFAVYSTDMSWVHDHDIVFMSDFQTFAAYSTDVIGA